jgi:hypothetical protein
MFVLWLIGAVLVCVVAWVLALRATAARRRNR